MVSCCDVNGDKVTRGGVSVQYAGVLFIAIRAIRNLLRRFILILRWRAQNKHNYTKPKGYFNISNVSVGKYTYGDLRVIDDGGSSKLLIGSFCSIADEVVFLLNADHDLSRISTYPFEVKMFHSKATQAIGKGDIVIEDDCWIGYGARILSGIRIGQGSVVATGAVVTKDVPPYSIVGGCPAHVIAYRFDESSIEQLLSVDFSGLDDEFYKCNQNLLLSTATSADINEFCNASQVVAR